jgi:hypothetical protein
LLPTKSSCFSRQQQAKATLICGRKTPSSRVELRRVAISAVDWQHSVPPSQPKSWVCQTQEVGFQRRPPPSLRGTTQLCLSRAPSPGRQPNSITGFRHGCLDAQPHDGDDDPESYNRAVTVQVPNCPLFDDSASIVFIRKHLTLLSSKPEWLQTSFPFVGNDVSARSASYSLDASRSSLLHLTVKLVFSVAMAHQHVLTSKAATLGQSPLARLRQGGPRSWNGLIASQQRTQCSTYTTPR